jgi:hypothetical protein
VGRPAGQSVEACYGLSVALHRMGDPAKSQEALAGVVTLPGGFARNRVFLADLYFRDNDDPHAAEVLQGVLGGDRHNLSALIRRRRPAPDRAVLREDRRVTHTAKTILNLSPTNVRASGPGAALATAQDYRAAAEYDRLIALDPEFRVPQREKARVLYSDHQFGAAAAAYQRIEVPTAAELFSNELADYARREARLQPLLEPYLHGGIPGQSLQADVAKIASTCGDPVLAAGLRRLLADYEARAAEQTAAHLEGEAKDKKDRRNYEAIPVYQSLIAVEPDNEER